MVNKRFLEFAQRHKKQEDSQKEKIYPTPEEYSISKDSYYNTLRTRDKSHPKRIGEALNFVRKVYKDLRKHYGSEDLVIASVGSSLVHTSYNDVDVVLLGIGNRNFGEELFKKADVLINGDKEKSDDEFKYNYTGSVAPGWIAGPSTSDFNKDYLIDLILDKTERSFEDWHKMMANSKQKYCILDKDVEESSRVDGGKNGK